MTRKKPQWEDRWLAVFRDTGIVRLACHAAGISRTHAYRQKENDPEFRRLWEEAEEDAVDALEAVARSRAKKGSDTLIIFLLKGLRSSKFRDTVRNEQVGADDAPPIRVAQVTLHDARQRPDDL